MVEPVTSEPRTRSRFRRLLRWSIAVVLVASGVHFAAWRLGFSKATTPGDVVLNVGATIDESELRASESGRHLVVVLHGLGRSAWSMWKLERLLEQHGYEVWNRTYDGAAMNLPELGRQLGERLEDHLAATADGRPVTLYAVAHSMGGLVLRSYLAEPGALEFGALVFLGTPNRGAVMAEQQRDTWYFEFFLGRKAARDLAPSEGVVAALGRAPARLGNVIGAAFDAEGYSVNIPGDDDGRVGVDEAHLDGERDAIVIGVSHTFLPTADEAHHQVLHFFRHQHFDHGS